MNWRTLSKAQLNFDTKKIRKIFVFKKSLGKFVGEKNQRPEIEMSDKPKDNIGEEESEDRRIKKLASSGAGESEESSPPDPNLKVTNLLLSHITFGLILLFRKEQTTEPTSQ